jgi:hypothetical protein
VLAVVFVLAIVAAPVTGFAADIAASGHRFKTGEGA